MNGRKQILNKINDFKNKVIKGKQLNPLEKLNPPNKSRKNLNHKSIKSHRNTTAPNKNPTKQSRYNHLKVEAKNNDIIKVISTQINNDINNQGNYNNILSYIADNNNLPRYLIPLNNKNINEIIDNISINSQSEEINKIKILSAIFPRGN